LSAFFLDHLILFVGNYFFLGCLLLIGHHLLLIGAIVEIIEAKRVKSLVES
jgi:hypothetical protein